MPSIFNAKLNFEQWLNVPLGTSSSSLGALQGGAAAAAAEESGHTLTVTEEEKLLIVDRLHKARPATNAAHDVEGLGFRV